MLQKISNKFSVVEFIKQAIKKTCLAIFIISLALEVRESFQQLFFVKCNSFAHGILESCRRISKAVRIYGFIPSKFSAEYKLDQTLTTKDSKAIVNIGSVQFQHSNRSTNLLRELSSWKK